MAEPLVSVCTISYNHEPYLRQTIESVLAQNTSFDFEMVIGEDCSADGTREIALEFQRARPDVVRVLPSTQRLGMHRNFERTLAACRGKYVALLEGDDFWTSPHKLQKQVDFLDSHPDCPLCFHRVRAFCDGLGSDKDFEWPQGTIKPRVGVPDVLADSIVPTPSILCRNGLVPTLPHWVLPLKMADWPYCILHALHGELGFIDESLAAYRRHSGGAWQQLSSLQQLEARLAFYEQIGPVLGPKYRVLVAHYIYTTCYTLSILHQRARNEREARTYARRCLRTSPALEPLRSNLRLLVSAAPPLLSNAFAWASSLSTRSRRDA